jgi:hypothetical protein
MIRPYRFSLDELCDTHADLIAPILREWRGLLAAYASTKRDKTARVPGNPVGDRESANARPHVSVCPACQGAGRYLVPDFFGPATWVDCGVCNPGADDDYMPFGVPV